DLLLRDPDDDGGVRELPRPPDDRVARHGLPAPERAQLLALPRLGALHVLRARRRDRPRRRLVRLRAARAPPFRPWPQHRLLRAGPDLQRCLVDRGVGQLRRHDLQAPRAGDVAEPDAALLLRDPRGLALARLRASRADARLRPARAPAAPELPLLRRRRRGESAALAAPLLVLRAPRGLHHR